MADEYTSGAINFTGLGNGTDFNQMVEKLIEVENTRVTRLTNWRSSWEQKNEQFKDLNSKMLSLKTTLEKFDTINEFMAKSVSTTDASLLTAKADSDAQAASHTVEIGQLATNDVHITASGVSDLTSSITTSNTTFTFSYGSESITMSGISAGTTLEGFVQLINNHTDTKDKIRASTIFDGSVYHLQLNGLDQGADNQIVISNTGTMVFGAGDFNETQNAVNSKIKVNGFPPAADEWIERSSNSVDDVIEGLTLTLNDAAVGTSTKINVVTDTDAIRANALEFVNQVNAIRAQIKSLTSVNEEGEGSILTGNYGVDIVGQNLKNITADLAQGFTPWDATTSSGDYYTALSQIGITTDAEEGSPNYGMLKLDADEFDKALENDPDGVAELFAAKNLGESNSPSFSYTSLIDGTTRPGVYDVEIVSDGTKIVSATINGEEAGIDGWVITAKTGEALGLGIRLDNTAAGTHTGSVSVKNGKVNEMIEELKELTKPYNEYTYEGGPLAVLQDNYNDIMDSIDKKIDYEQTRIEKLERNMKLKFSRLDALLGQYELRQGALQSQLGQLE